MLTAARIATLTAAIAAFSKGEAKTGQSCATGANRIAPQTNGKQVFNPFPLVFSSVLQ